MAMKTERLIVLLSKEEKARLARLAEREQVSMGELARAALIRLEDFRPETKEATAAQVSNRAGVGTDLLPEVSALSPDQTATLERLADVTLQTMQRANLALDKAFAEVEATKAYFADKRAAAEGRPEAR